MISIFWLAYCFLSIVKYLTKYIAGRPEYYFYALLQLSYKKNYTQLSGIG